LFQVLSCCVRFPEERQELAATISHLCTKVHSQETQGTSQKCEIWALPSLRIALLTDSVPCRLIPKADRKKIHEYLFREGVLVAKKDYNLPKHGDIDTKNLFVCSTEAATAV
ncbi:Plectin/S10 domain-containing protein isoform 1, partial [Cladophialophora immunda]